jgi:NarL family two-component system response regulator LiaR
MRKIKVLIVDDHPFIRRGIKACLDMESDMEVVAEAGSGQAAIQKSHELNPDVVLLDLVLPDIPGTQVIREICSRNAAVRVVVCSNFSDDGHIVSAMQAGAFGYLVKTDPPDRIVQAIRDAAVGKPTLNQYVESRVFHQSEFGHIQKRNQPPLTAREIDILKMMARGLSNKEIAEQCFISEGTVRTHIFHIQAKLDLDSRSKLVIYAVRQGLVLP